MFNPADKQFDPSEAVLERRELGGGRLDSYYLGGRILRPFRERILIGAGVGAVHHRFKAPELRSGPALDQNGWGAYVLTSVAFQLDSLGRFRLSLSPRLEVVQGREAWLHRNRWLMLPVEIGFSW